MPAIQRILVVADPKPEGSPALRRAAGLARVSGASIELCSFVYDPLVAAPGELYGAEVLEHARRDLLQERTDWAAAQTVAWCEQGLRAEYDVLWTALPHEVLAAKVIAGGYGLVIKDVQRDDRLLRWLHTSADWKLLRYCPAPLMIVGALANGLPRRIAAAVDALQEMQHPAPLNDAIVGSALQLGRYCQAAVDLVSVFPGSTVPSANGRQLAALRQAAERDHRRSFEALADRLEVPEDCRHRPQGPVDQALARYVRRSHTDLLVLGSAYRSGFSRLLLGSTVEDVLMQVGCDVLLVRPPDFVDELRRHIDLDAAAMALENAAAPALPPRVHVAA